MDRADQQSALAIGVAFLAAAVIAFSVLPSRRALIRPASDPSQQVPVPGVVLPIAAPAVVSAWQFPILLAWWEETRRVLEQLTAGGGDPLGLWMVPEVMVSAPLLIAALVAALFIITAIAVAAARSPLDARVLRACCCRVDL
jgi:hypothetical protein